MSWNYRVVMTEYDMGDEFNICEVYYNDDGDITGYTDPVSPNGGSVCELSRDIELMMEAFEKPVLSETVLRRDINVESPIQF